MADQDEFDDDALGEFEEYDEDFESEPLTAPGKPGSGMDTFSIVASVCLLLAAIAVLGYGVLYEVYDSRLGGIVPAKTIPTNDFAEFTVKSFGRDDTGSGVYNYAILKGGRAQGLVPGTILWIQSPQNRRGLAARDHWVTLMVSDDLGEQWCRADIIGMALPKDPPPTTVQPVPTVSADDEGAESDDGAVEPEVAVVSEAAGIPFDVWRSQERLTAAAESLPLLLDRSGSLKAVLAPWSHQKLRRDVEEKFGGHIRVRKGE